MNGHLGDLFFGMGSAAQRVGDAPWILEWGWPGPLWIPLVVAAAVSVAIVYFTVWERAGGFSRIDAIVLSLRLAVVLILTAMAMQPRLTARRAAPALTVVIIDDSLSMATTDRYGPETSAELRAMLRRWSTSDQVERWQIIEHLLSEGDAAWLRRLSEGRRLRTFLLSEIEEISGGPPEVARRVAAHRPFGRSTRLGAAVLNLLDRFREGSLAAIVLMTDGVNNQGPSLTEAAEAARANRTPLYFVAIGAAAPTDVRLFDLLADEIVFADDLVVCRVNAAATGWTGRPVTVVVRDADSGRELTRQTVTIRGEDVPETIRLNVRPPHEGRIRLVFEAEPIRGESNRENNRIEHTLEVRKQKVRVLLADELPSWEYRFLRNVLGRDEAIELHTWLQSADPQHAVQDSLQLPVFPVDRQSLFAYDVLVLGDVNPVAFGQTALNLTAEFVSQPGRGGALVLWAGPRRSPEAWMSTPLAPLLPFDGEAVRRPASSPQPFAVEPTALGLLSPMMQLDDSPNENLTVWRKLPRLNWLVELESLRRGARVLAEHPTEQSAEGNRLPLIVLHQVGGGWVLFHATDETFRWRLGWGDRYYARYWVQTLRFLARGRLLRGDVPVTLVADRGDYMIGEQVRLRAKFNEQRGAAGEDEQTVIVSGSDGPDRRIVLQRSALNPLMFEGEFVPDSAGEYRAKLVAAAGDREATAMFRVLSPIEERSRTAVDWPAMRRAAEASGGQVFTADQAHRLPDELPRPRSVVVETLPPIPLWNTSAAIVLVIMAAALAWVIRRRQGLT